CLHYSPVYVDVDQHRGAGNVHVPNAVMHELVMPLAHTGFEVDRDNRFAEQIRTRTMTAVIIARRQLDGQICEPQLFIDADLAPDSRIARVLGRILFPGVVSELAWLRNGVEDPQPLPRASVECAHITLHIRLAARNSARPVRRAHDHDVARNYGSRMQSDFARHRIDLLIVVFLQVDDAVLAEAGHHRTGLR